MLMDIVIILMCVIIVWLCLATAYNKPMSNSDISKDVDKKFGKKNK